MQPVSATSFSDPTLALLDLENHGTHVQEQGALKDIEVAHARLEKLRAELQRARERARKAAKKGGFWKKCAGILKGDVANFAGVVATAAAVAATGGTGAAVVIVAASLASKAAKAAGAPAALCTGLAATSIVAGACTGNLSTLVQIARGVQTGARIAGAGADHISDLYHAEEIDARADGKQIDIHRQDEEDRESDAFEHLGSITVRANQQRATIMDIQKARAESQMEILNRIGGA